MITSLLSRACAWREVRRAHLRATGRLPALFPPRTLNEHIVHRIIFDRDPRLKVISDKVAVRRFISNLVGERYVVPLLGKWRRVDEVEWDRLPASFVLKPNQTSGPFIVVNDASTADRFGIEEQMRPWLRRRRPFLPEIKAEWGYQGLPRFITAEPLLTAPGGGAVEELNVFAFGGQPAIIRLFKGRKLTKERRGGWFDVDGRQLAIRTNHIRNEPSSLPEPVRQEAIAVSATLSAGFSSLRVDFYITSAGLLIGELTPYSWGGECHFHPPELDMELGRLWRSPDTAHIPTYAPSDLEMTA